MSAIGGSKIFINFLVISIALQQYGEAELLIFPCLKGNKRACLYSCLHE
jgi:hypothetical protein